MFIYYFSVQTIWISWWTKWYCINLHFSFHFPWPFLCYKVPIKSRIHAFACKNLSNSILDICNNFFHYSCPGHWLGKIHSRRVSNKLQFWLFNRFTTNSLLHFNILLCCLGTTFFCYNIQLYEYCTSCGTTFHSK